MYRCFRPDFYLIVYVVLLLCFKKPIYCYSQIQFAEIIFMRRIAVYICSDFWYNLEILRILKLAIILEKSSNTFNDMVIK